MCIRDSFETMPALVSGIELSTSGLKLAWSIADYLAALEKGVAEVLTANSASAIDATPQSGK